MSNDWKIGSVVFNATTGQPVPLQTSQGGKPYNLELIRGLEERIARLTEERDRYYTAHSDLYVRLMAAQEENGRLRDEVGRLREALEEIRQRALQDSPEDVAAEIASGRTISDMYGIAKAALAPAEGTEGT